MSFVLVFLCVWGSLYDFESGLFTNAVQLNNDNKVANFISDWLPLNHKPDLMNNTVYVMADLYNIIDLNEVSETLTTKLWVYIAYILDIPKSAWDDLGPDFVQIFPGANKVWMPDVIILNKVETKAVSGSDPVVLKYYCCEEENSTRCEYCGTLVVFPSSRTEVTTCNIDVVDFPFDEQNCVISIGPWFTDVTSYERYENGDGQEVGPYRIEIIASQTKMSLISYEENSQWKLLGAPVVNKTRVAQHDSKKTFEMFEYTLELKRKPQFFIFTLILPCFCLTSLTVLAVLIPVESGEKMGLGVTVLLAQTVNLLILTSYLPASSQYFPFLGFYVLVTIILISVCLVYNAIVINIYYHGYWGILNLIKKKTKIGPSSTTSTKSNDVKEIVTKMEEQAGVSRQTEAVENCSPEEEELRKKRCIVADHVFAVIIFIAVVIVHLYFFSPYM